MEQDNGNIETFQNLNSANFYILFLCIHVYMVMLNSNKRKRYV